MLSGLITDRWFSHKASCIIIGSSYGSLCSFRVILFQIIKMQLLWNLNVLDMTLHEQHLWLLFLPWTMQIYNHSSVSRFDHRFPTMCSTQVTAEVIFSKWLLYRKLLLIGPSSLKKKQEGQATTNITTTKRPTGLCEPSYDAVALISDRIFFFKDQVILNTE